MAQPTSPEPAAVPTDRPATSPPGAAERPAGAAEPDLARQLAERTAELAAAQRRLQVEIEERTRVEQALRDSEALAQRAQVQLRQAIESVSDGFVLWDADDRLVLCNQRYRDLYPAIAEHIRPGIGFAELILRLAEQGYIREAIGREAAWVAGRVRQRRERPLNVVERRLANGQWMRISGRRTADGGIVTVHTDITELKRQAEELRAREAQLRGIVDNIPGVVYRRVRHPDGRISYPYHSSQFEPRHGLDPAAVAKDPSLLLDAVHPEDRPAWLAAIEESARRLTPFSGDCRIRVRGGGFGWFRTLATPTRQEDGSVVWDGVSIDITELKATEEALRASEARYRHLVEAGPIALLSHRDGRVVFANARALELFGTRSPDDVVGRPLVFLLHPDDRARLQPRPGDEPASSPATEPCEIRILRLDGQILDVEMVSVPVTEADGEPATQVVLLDITERKRAEERVRHLAHHDPLTGLPNRALLLDRLHQALLQARRERGRIAVLMLDLDHFKAVNDTFGHAIGDRLLCAVADRLRATVRESDTLARYGGDEFTLVQTRLREPQGVDVLAQKILEAVAEPFLIEDQVVRTTTSVGVAVHPEQGSEPGPLLEHADIALYRAKALGRNRAEVFADAMKADLQVRRALAGRQDQALEATVGADRGPATGTPEDAGKD
jgi:diguanylate cyclase (GGDEF)-like protein/PAS domain S-box-containing protein